MGRKDRVPSGRGGLGAGLEWWSMVLPERDMVFIAGGRETCTEAQDLRRTLHLESNSG